MNSPTGTTYIATFVFTSAAPAEIPLRIERRLLVTGDEWTTHTALQELDATGHLLRLKHLVNQNQTADHLTQRAGCLVTVGDARMFSAATGKSQKVGVVGDDHATLLPDEDQLRLVALRAQSGFDGGRDINPMSAQGECNIRIDMLVQMKPNPFSHG
jgi:hypothetical protein